MLTAKFSRQALYLTALLQERRIVVVPGGSQDVPVLVHVARVHKAEAPHLWGAPPKVGEATVQVSSPLGHASELGGRCSVPHPGNTGSLEAWGGGGGGHRPKQKIIKFLAYHQ